MHSTGVCSLRESDWCERVLNKSALPQLLSVAAAPAVAATHRANAGPRTIKKKKSQKKLSGQVQGNVKFCCRSMIRERCIEFVGHENRTLATVCGVVHRFTRCLPSFTG